MPLRMAILSNNQIEAMKRHRYAIEGTSILAFLDVWYLWLAKRVPPRVTANLVTIAGLFSVVLSCASVAFFSYTGDHQNLRFSGYYAALGFAMWMTCDSMDGKVARLRGQSSLFGEVLDHGGDAFALLFSAVALTCILGLNDSPFVTVVWILNDVIAYYLSETYVIYICGKGKIESLDFYEILVIYIGVSLCHSIFGQEIWRYTIFSSFGFKVIHIFYGIKIIVSLEVVLGKTRQFYDAAKSRHLGFWLAVSPLVPAFVIVTSALVAFFSVSHDVMQENSMVFALCYGFCFVKLHIQLIIVNMSKSRLNLLGTSSIFPVIIMCGCLFLEADNLEKKFLIYSTIATGLDAVIYLLRLLHELSRILDGPIFLLDQNQNKRKDNNIVTK